MQLFGCFYPSDIIYCAFKWVLEELRDKFFFIINEIDPSSGTSGDSKPFVDQ